MLLHSDYFNKALAELDADYKGAISALKPSDAQGFFRLQTSRLTLEELVAKIRGDKASGERANKELIGDKPKRRT